MSELYKVKRMLRCVTDGRVIPLVQLAGANSRGYGSSGFAVLPPLWDGTFAERFLSHMVSVHAPADGVVTAVGEELSFRTGDGITVIVAAGVSAGNLCRVGLKVRAGELIGMMPRETLRRNGLGGAIIVLLQDHSRVTELHVISGKHKAGQEAASYKLRPPDIT